MRKIKDFLRPYSVKILFRFGLFPANSTDLSCIKKLLVKLHPVFPKKDLIRLGSKTRRRVFVT